MNLKSFLPCSLVAFSCIACSQSDADTSPLPSEGPEKRVESAQKGIESSNMTPEQKQAAAEYMRQGASNAQKIESSARASGASVPK